MRGDLVWQQHPPHPAFAHAVHKCWYARGTADQSYLALVFQPIGTERAMSIYQLAAHRNPTQNKHNNVQEAMDHVNRILSENTVVPRYWGDQDAGGPMNGKALM